MAMGKQACTGWIALVAGALGLGAIVLPPPVHAQADITPLVLGTPRQDGNYAGAYLRRVYQALFDRVGVPIDIRYLPTARLTAELSSGHLDGDLGRPWGFGERNPDMVRVDEPAAEIVFALWAVDPQAQLNSLNELAAAPRTVTYTRGVLECETQLRPVLPKDQLVSTSTTANALAMLYAGRNPLYCGVDLAVLSDAALPEHQGKARLRQVLRIAPAQGLYLYLNRRHAALVPRLNASLKAMKAEGVVERLRQQTLRDFNLAPY